MCVHGADPKGLELRVPPIKAAMRYWWRALNGQYTNSTNLYEAEAAIFGGTNGDKGQASAFKLQLQEEREVSWVNTDLLPHRREVRGNPLSKPCYEAGGWFKIRIIVRENNEGVTVEYIENLLWLTGVLGGIGQRARRGFGNFILCKKDENCFVSFDVIRSKVQHFSGMNVDQSGTVITSHHKCKWPSLLSIKLLSKKSNGYADLLFSIGYATHNLTGRENYAKEVGKGNPRFASPIHFSIVPTGENEYRTLVTVVTLPKNRGKTRKPTQLQEDLINEVTNPTKNS